MSGAASSLPPLTVGFVDPCCAKGYTPVTLHSAALGGTEATVLRVAGALARRARILHFQRGRDEVEWTSAGHIRPLSDAFLSSARTTFVVVNSWKIACKMRKVHPEAKIVLWLHVHPGRHNRPMAQALKHARICVVCVSRSQAAWLRAFLGDSGPLRINHIYNPVDGDLVADATPRDSDLLLFASSPHKGLSQIFGQFREARAEIPSLKLAVADPGYLAWDTSPVPEGVTFLGSLPHHALIAEMRRALCLFYPQTTFAETFGLVLAEANAVGTPVLVHRDLGANAEVVGDPAQLVDGADRSAILDRLRKWRAGPPVVQANPAFRLDAVAERWPALLGLDTAAVDACRRIA